MEQFIYFKKWDKPIIDDSPFIGSHGIKFHMRRVFTGEWVCEDERVSKVEVDYSGFKMSAEKGVEELGDMFVYLHSGENKKFKFGAFKEVEEWLKTINDANTSNK